MNRLANGATTMTAKSGADVRGERAFRSDRIRELGGKWFFRTREGTTEGPFPNREETLRQIELYVARIKGSFAQETARRLHWRA